MLSVFDIIFVAAIISPTIMARYLPLANAIGYTIINAPQAHIAPKAYRVSMTYHKIRQDFISLRIS